MSWDFALRYALDPAGFARGALGFEPDPKQELVLQSHAKRGILCCCRQWGKSTITAIKAVHRAATAPGSLVLVLSPGERQSGEFVAKAETFVRKLGLPARGDGRNSISLLLPNGSRIVGLPGTEATVRGFSAVSLLLIDEASRVPDELYKAVRPMLARAPVSGGDLWLMSTPYGKRGFFYQAWSEGGAEWTRVLATAADCKAITPEFLEQERRAQGDLWFRQEYGCEFVSTDEHLFDEELIRARMAGDDAKPLVPGGALWAA